MLGFVWNTRKIKAITYTQEGNKIIETTPGAVVKNPNRLQPETIIQSLCVVVKELMEIQEAQAERIANLSAQVHAQPKAPQPEQTNG